MAEPAKKSKKAVPSCSLAGEKARRLLTGQPTGSVHHLGGMVDSPEKLLADLIALPSVNPAFLPPGDDRAGEWRITDFLASRAARAGLTIEFQNVFRKTERLPARENLIIRLAPRTKPRRRVLLAPHLDTVGAADMPGDNFNPTKRNGRLHGRGACDTKGSVAAMFTAFLRLAEKGPAPAGTEVVFVGLVDEENGQEGSRVLAASKLKGDLAIVGEPTELQVITAHKGDLWLKLTTKGKAAHGARPELGRNAIHEMARVIDLLETSYANSLRTRRHPVLGPGTINVGMVRGGTQPNIVPDRCEIQVDRRTIPGEKDAQVQREILKFVREAGLRAELDSSKENSCLSMETDASLPLVREFMSLRKQAKPIGVDFFCDAAIISAGGTPSVVFGPGNIAQAHTRDEWISLRSLRDATEILTTFLRALP
ncbi:MAG TPA: M20/M25/M40 family metallo-hydrolase [Verrucomicrobiae bacterium]|nr:M20/M25/M40 family metallo-hydrolase [Verrucomicrobiae bacterium]